MNGTPDLDLLNVFVVVAETSSFSAAAKRLGLPKSTVSRNIARLEQGLGAQLLHRTTHAVGLTTAGTALFERVAPLVTSLRQAVGTLPEQAEEPTGVLRVTAGADFGVTALGELVTRFTLLHPALRLELRLTNELLDFVAEGLDVALRASHKPLEDSTLVARKLGAMELQIFAAPGYLARRGTPRAVEDLAGHDWVINGGNTTVARMKIPEERRRIVANSFLFVREALRAGAGLGVLPYAVAHEDVEAGRLVRVLAKFSEGTGTLYFVHPRMQHVPAKITAFRDFLLEHMATGPVGVRA